MAATRRRQRQPGKVYSYRMEALNASGARIATSNIDTIVTATFTDAVVRIGLPVKAVHLEDLVIAANILRVQGGLPAITLPDAARGKTIRKAHFDFLSKAIDEGLAAFGAAAPPFAIAPNSIIRAPHAQQLRDAMR